MAAAGSKGIPATLRDLMLARFMSLDDDARHLVSVAAVIGVRSPRGWLVHASGLPADRARRRHRAAADAGVLVAEAGAYEFRHTLLRQAVLDELLPDELVELHHVVADALEQHPEAAPGIDRVAELARHWDAAQEATFALTWLVTAGKHAHETYAFEAAVNDYERALVWWDAVADPVATAGVDRATVLLRAADAAREAGSVERGRRAGLVGNRRGVRPRRGPRRRGRGPGVDPSVERQPFLRTVGARTGASAPGVWIASNLQARARFLVGYVHHLAINATPKEIRGPATEMIATLDLVDDPVLEARGHMVNAWCHEAYGEFDRVEAEYVRAAELARRGSTRHVGGSTREPRRIEAVDARLRRQHRTARCRRRVDRALRLVALSRPRQRDAQCRVLPSGRARGGTRGRRCVRRATPRRNRPLDAYDM